MNKKHILGLVLSGLILCSCTGCVSTDSEDSKSVSINSSEDSAQSTTSTTEDSIGDVDQTTTTTEQQNNEPFSVEEQLLWEHNGVSVTAMGIVEDSFWGSELKLLVENNSENDIALTTDAIIVNGYMISDLTSIDVTAGNKSNDTVTLFESELEAAGIEQIGEIELYLRMYDPDSYDTIASSECITIQTSAYSEMEENAEVQGTIIYDENDIKIIAQYVDEESFWGSALLLCIENNRSENITISTESLAINGFMVSDYMYAEIYAGKKSIDDITIFQSDLDDNGITSIEELEVSFSIHNDSYDTIDETEKLSLSVD